MSETNEAGEVQVKKRNRTVEIIAIFCLVAGVAWMASILFDFGGSTRTNNAQVDGDIVAVTSHVTAYIKEIRFDRYATVHAGDTLVVLDDNELAIKVAQAEADLEMARASLRAIEQAVITSRSSLSS